MMLYNHMAVFACIVREQGISATAEQLGMPKSTVSLRLRELEQALGVRLIQRTTRQMKLTEHGSGMILGRSDSTLKRMGVRMGSSDFYSVIETMPEVADSLIVGVDVPGGSYWMPLFVGCLLSGTMPTTLPPSTLISVPQPTPQ